MFETNLEPWEKLPDNYKTLAPLIMSICFPPLKDKPEIGKYYRLYPDGCISGNGTKYHGNIRIGKEPEKLLIYLNGGGVAFDGHSAARPNNFFTLHQKETYYSNDGEWIGDYFLREGLNAQREDNPFLDWSAIQILYCTGDFHCGDGECSYTAQDGTPRMMPCYGYRNAMAVIDLAKQYLPAPKQILIAGSSAGGFGVSLLAEDMIRKFPDCPNVTCCVDSSLILNPCWHDIAKDFWHAPKHIVERLSSGNLVTDCLKALHKKYGNAVRILFMSSIRDAMLPAMENAMMGKDLASDKASGDRYQKELKAMCRELMDAIPDLGLFIFTAPMDAKGWDETLTLHCALNNYFFFERGTNGQSVCEWLMNAVNGKTEQLGLNLLDT